LYKQILIAQDGSPGGNAALKTGTALARLHGARLAILSVVESRHGLATSIDPAGILGVRDDNELLQHHLDDAFRRLAADGLSCEIRLEKGQPFEWILSVASEIGADLVLVGKPSQNVFR
jgi:nucleotide-binding universal stress UspA family protein